MCTYPALITLLKPLNYKLGDLRNNSEVRRPREGPLSSFYHMRTKVSHTEGGSSRQRRELLPEVQAGLVLVKSKDAGRSRRARRTWVLPILRVLALAASMRCLTPTGGMVTGMSKMDAWSGGSESEQQQHEDRRSSHG